VTLGKVGAGQAVEWAVGVLDCVVGVQMEQREPSVQWGLELGVCWVSCEV
jgi:hypothetical protein